MKKIYALLSMMGLFLMQSNAQITVTRNDFGSIGDVIYYGTDSTLTGLSVGASGANKTWNFTTVVFPDTYDTATFKDPLTIPGAPAEANIALDEGMIGASFFNIDSNSVKTILPLSDFGINNQQLTITNFPLNYGDVIKDSSFTKTQGVQEDYGFSGLPYDSIRITIDVHTTSTVDGWGSLVVPSGTNNVLRVRNVTNVDVTLEGKILLFWTTIPVNMDRNQILYAWYGNNKKYALAEAQLDTNGAITSFRYQVDSVPKKPTTGLAKANKSNLSIAAYPNPADEQITFNTNASIEKLDIMDITGQLVATSMMNNRTTTVSTQEMPAGIYIARVQDIDGSYSMVKFVVQH
jgi:Secretion system C-terminal sorting domain